MVSGTSNPYVRGREYTPEVHNNIIVETCELQYFF